MNPVSSYLRMVRKYKPAFRFYPRALLYFIKLLAWEPFRLLERTFAGEAPPLQHPPVFILGYYRSGTTHLQEVLLQDPRFGYLNFFQCVFATAFQHTEKLLRPLFERIVRLVRVIHPAHQIPFSFALPAEEDVAMIFTGSEQAANWAQLFPTHFRAIYAKTGLLRGTNKTQREALKKEMDDLIRRTARANGGKQLVLKSPPQTGRLAMLLELYPEAKFVFIRRDPHEVYKSNLKLWKSFETQWLETPTPEMVTNHILWSYEQAHANYERDKRLVAPGQLTEVTFEDMMAEPLGTIAQVYGDLGLEGFEENRARFEAYLWSHHQAPEPYRMTEDEIERVEQALGPLLRQWGYLRNAAPPRTIPKIA